MNNKRMQEMKKIIESAMEFPGCPHWLKEECRESLQSNEDHVVAGTRDGIFRLPFFVRDGRITGEFDPFFLTHCDLLRKRHTGQPLH